MKKIISLFARNYPGEPGTTPANVRLVRDQLVPGAEWVAAGEGVPTPKWDGTSVMFRRGEYFRRFELRSGRIAPAGFEPAQDPDPLTGDCPGWVPVGDGPADAWHMRALEQWGVQPDATYELCGPRFNRNPHQLPHDTFFRHGDLAAAIADAPRTFQGLRVWLATIRWEGVVWHHPDGRRVKIKRRDFGHPWPVR